MGRFCRQCGHCLSCCWSDVVTLKLTGFRPWLVQRISAPCMLVLILIAIVFFWLEPKRTYAEWTIWVARPIVSLLILTFFAALLAHMWVGLRDVLLDYAKPAAMRRVFLAALACALLGIAVWVCWILLRLQL